MKNKALLQFNKSKKENFNFLKFNDFIKFKSGVDSKNNISNYNDKTAIPWIKLGDIKNNKINFEKCDFLLNETKNLAKLNDLLVCWSTNPGYSFFASKPLLFSTAFYKFENKEENVTNAFIHFWLQKNKKNVEKNAVGSTLKKVNMKLFGNILINHPSLEEQTKIANFLTLLDKQIQLIERKLELYELRKKYYLNNIFCDEYSNLPKLRFKNFCDKWLCSNFGNLFDIKASGDLDISKFSKIKDDLHNFPVFSNSVSNKGLYGYYSEKSNNGNCLTITARGEIGVCFFRDNDFKGIGRLLIARSENLNHIFSSYYINSKLKIYEEKTCVSQLTIPKFSLNKINYPSLEEQTKIDNLFSSLDESIQNLKKQKDQLTKRKTYYLNNMFV